MYNAVMMILVTDAKDAAEGEPDLIERVKKCMRASYRHWIVTDEGQKFDGAIAAALLLSEGEDKERMEAAIDALKALAAAVQGIPVDMEAVMNRHKGIEPVPLSKFWNEIRAEDA